MWLAANNGDMTAIETLLKVEGYVEDKPSLDGTKAVEIALGHNYMDVHNLLIRSHRLLIGLLETQLSDSLDR